MCKEWSLSYIVNTRPENRSLRSRDGRQMFEVVYGYPSFGNAREYCENYTYIHFVYANILVMRLLCNFVCGVSGETVAVDVCT